MSTKTDIVLLGCDWGTTSLRVYALNAAGAVLDQRASDQGLIKARQTGFEQALQACAGDWLKPARVVLLAGMVGARGGWLEAPYVPCPLKPAELAAQLVQVPTKLAQVYIVPGVCLHDNIQFEVMRGEETQLCGALMRMKRHNGVFVLPGTHTKWVLVRAGVIDSFNTFMTGDIFAALRHHTALQLLLPPDEQWDWDGEGFKAGVVTGSTIVSGGELLSRLFSVRTAGLAEQYPPAQLGPYLSGMLLGAELHTMRHLSRRRSVVIGAAEIVNRYIAAAQVLGRNLGAAPADLAAVGLASLARLAGLITIK